MVLSREVTCTLESIVTINDCIVPTLQLSDFGLSILKGRAGSDSMMQTMCGTPMYMGEDQFAFQRNEDTRCMISVKGSFLTVCVLMLLTIARRMHIVLSLHLS